MKKRRILKILLAVLIGVFLILGVAAVLLAQHQKAVKREMEREAALEALAKIPKLTPTPVPSVSPTPTPAPTATPTPTPAITVRSSFNPDDYWDTWYSSDGTASVYIYDIGTEHVSFSFRQNDKSGAAVSSADVTAEVAGNAAQLEFTDSQGAYISGSLVFDNGQLFAKMSTGDSSYPHVNCIMTRNQPVVQAAPTPTPQVTVQENPQPAGGGDFYFADSDSRYLTDEELSVLSAADLELAKNEIYARRGRIFRTDYIAAYFNSKPWYQGTIDADTFDAQQDSLFNEYEIANISKIVEWEARKQ